MKFWIGVTDNNWFKYLSKIQPDEVNFWQPSATPPFKNAPTGMPFLFKLRRPFNHIAGGGFFVTYSRLPLSIAWEVFGVKNGCSSLEELRQLINPLVSGGIRDGDIGCTVLANPFFLDRENWLQIRLPGRQILFVERCMIQRIMPAEIFGRRFKLNSHFNLMNDSTGTKMLALESNFRNMENLYSFDQGLDSHLFEYWLRRHTRDVVR